MIDSLLEEEAIASVVAMLGNKRERDEYADADAAGGGDADFIPAKIARVMEMTPVPGNVTHANDPNLQPAPFFYYKDYSEMPDPDPLSPLTPPGRVPNFPAKMHAILSRTDLADIVCWMPHGRSWRVLKPREFEIRVIPTYFGKITERYRTYCRLLLQCTHIIYPVRTLQIL